MDIAEENIINAHIWQRREYAIPYCWSLLRGKKSYYEVMLLGLVQYGNVLCNINGNEDVVGFTRILYEIGLPFQFVKSGIKLTETAKIEYRENVMNRKPPVVVYKKNDKYLKVGKEDRYSNRIGWAEQILLNNKLEKEKENQNNISE